MRKKFSYIIFFVSIFLINFSVKAVNLFGDSDRKDVCGLSLPSNVPTFTSGLFNVVKILVPIILIIMGMIDFAKAVIAQDEKKMKDSTSSFIRRLIAAIFIFLIVAIVQFVFSKVSSDNGFNSCMKCVLSNNCNSSSEYYTKTIKSTCVSNCENIKDATGKSVCLQKCKETQSTQKCDTCDKIPTSEKTACLANCQTSTVTTKKSENITKSVNFSNPKKDCPKLTTKSKCNANNLCKWDKTNKKCNDKSKSTTSTKKESTNEDSSTSEQQKVVNYARNFALSKPNHRYVYGGNTLCTTKPFNASGCGVDCSSFVQLVYKEKGYDCLYKHARTADAQANYLGAKTYTKNTKLKVGDLLFYTGTCGQKYCHVTMYTGSGEVVHASSSTTGVIVSKIGYKTPARYASVIGNSKCKKSK